MKNIILRIFVLLYVIANGLNLNAAQATILWQKDVTYPTGKSCNYTHTYSLKNNSSINASNYSFGAKSAQKLSNGSWITTSFNGSTVFIPSPSLFSINAGQTKNVSITFCATPASGIGKYKLFFSIKDNSGTALPTLSGGDLNTIFDYYPTPFAPTAEVLSCSEIKVLWVAIDGAKSYDVYRNGSFLKNTISTSYTDNTVVKGPSYYYQIKAKDENGETDLSPISNQTIINAPDAPTSLSATIVTTSQIYLSWNPVNNASVYGIFRDGVYLKGVTTPYFTDKDVSTSTSHCYQVNAIDLCAKSSPYSENVCTESQSFHITTTSNPSNGGITSSDKESYSMNESCILYAAPNSGFKFDNWSEDGVVVSSDPSYTFAVTSDKAIVANFTKLELGKSCPDFDVDLSTLRVWLTEQSSITANDSKIFRCRVTPNQTYIFKTGCGDGASSTFDTYLELYDKDCNLISSDDNSCETQSSISWTCDYQSESYVYLKVKGVSESDFGDFVLAYKRIDPNCVITTSSNPTEGGSTSGDGVYTSSESCTVTAIANDGFHFVNWGDEESQIVSTDSIYTFVVSSGRRLTANFIQQKDGIESIYSTSLSVYPNPAGKYMTVDAGGANTILRIQVLNVSGYLVEEIKVSTAKKQIDISSLKAGDYLIRVYTTNGKFLKKIVKK